jgi:DNA-binding transcriptional MerR regulator
VLYKGSMVEERDNAALQRPTMVANTLGISTVMLRRYARAYEEVYGKLPRDRRNGRLYTKENVQRLRTARALVLRKRAPSMETALRHLSEGSIGQVASSSPLADGSDPYALLVEELRWLREVAEKQNRRLAMMESMMMTLLTSRVTETSAHASSSHAEAQTSERINEAPKETSEPLRTDGEAITDDALSAQRPRWKRIGLMTVLAGAVPTMLATTSLLIGYSLVGYAINDPPLRTTYLFFYFLLHLLPLPLGIWAGLAWPGRHLIGYVLLGVLAGAIEAIVSRLFVILSGGLVELRFEDILTVVSTIILFLAGGAVGDSIEKRRAVRGRSNKVSEYDRGLSPTTVVVLQYVLPPVLTFFGIALQAVVTLMQG